MQKEKVSRRWEVVFLNIDYIGKGRRVVTLKIVAWQLGGWGLNNGNYSMQYRSFIIGLCLCDKVVMSKN